MLLEYLVYHIIYAYMLLSCYYHLGGGLSFIQCIHFYNPATDRRGDRGLHQQGEQIWWGHRDGLIHDVPVEEVMDGSLRDIMGH